MSRLLPFTAGVLIVALVLGLILRQPEAPAYDEAVCAGPPLRTLAEVEEAREQGYEIHPRHRCIDKASFEAVARQRAEWEQAQQAKPAREADAGAARETTLAETRRAFRTAVSLPPAQAPLPQPPQVLFVRSDYQGGQGRALGAFVTPDPKDGRRHPAIIWLTGGDSSTLGDFWIPGSARNDQSARAFRDAGVVTMFPTLRGGNQDAAGRELFLGEVDDVLAAATHLAALPYVDPEHIYLGGHSTGGTLALLVAEAGGRFQGVFAFGPVGEIDAYPPALLQVDFSRYDPMERKLRSPIHWLAGIERPTWIIEGRDAPGNLGELERLCRRSSNPQLHCIPVAAHDHFSVLAAVTPTIAARVAIAAEGIPFALDAAEFDGTVAGR